MEKPPLYEITIRFGDYSFTLNRKNTVLCYYENELADHIIHQFGDPIEPDTAIIPKTGNEILWNTLELMGLEVIAEWEEENIDRSLFLSIENFGQFVVEAAELITEITATVHQEPNDWYNRQE